MYLNRSRRQEAGDCCTSGCVQLCLHLPCRVDAYTTDALHAAYDYNIVKEESKGVLHANK